MMKLSDNHSRAQKMVDSWPTWKRDVSLTKYSTSVPVAASDSHDRARKTTSSEQERQEATA